jgi:hypothetical protein
MEFASWDPHTNALMKPYIFHYILGMVMERGLELMVSTIGSNFGKEEVGVHPSVGIISPASPFNEGSNL